MRAFFVSVTGGSAVEYALVLACIALLGMGALYLVAANVRSLFNSASDRVAASSSGGNSGSSLDNGQGNGGQNFWYWSGHGP
jgi:Flp pilus assembly pilin Flp